MKIFGAVAVVALSTVILTSCSENNEDYQPVAGTINLEQPTQSDVIIGEIKTQTETTSETSLDSTVMTESSETYIETSSIVETIVETFAETSKISEQDSSEETTLTEILTQIEPVITTSEITDCDFSMESPVKIIYNGQCVSLEDINDVKSFFGETISPEVAVPSCMGEGDDVIYTYSDFVVTAFVSESGTVQVTSIISTGVTLENPKGLFVGMSEKEALAALGTYRYEEEGQCVYFLSDNGIVIEIDYMII